MKVYIQSVPERIQYVNQWMIPMLTATGLEDVSFVVDHDHRGSQWNAARIWELISKEETPGLVLQDDLILHSSFPIAFPETMTQFHALQMQAMSLYAPARKAVDAAFQAGCNFIENYDFLWLQGIVLTPDFAAGLSRMVKGLYGKQLIQTDDTIVQWHVRESGVPVWTTLPSLVQHNLEIKSALGHPSSIGGRPRSSRLWQAIPIGHFAEMRSRIIR